MLTKEMAEKQIAEGLSAVCAWCEHWHNNKDQFANVKCGQPDCGGPGGDIPMAFPKYKGPWQNNLVKLCLMCGAEPVAAVEIHGEGFLGICKRHMKPLKRLLSHPGGKPRVGKLPVVNERMVPIPKVEESESV